MPVPQDASLPTASPQSSTRRGRVPWAVWIAVAVIYPLASLLFRLRYRNAERIPRTVPVLLVLNHISMLDPLASARLVWDHGRVPHFLGKESVFRGPAGPLLRRAGQIPVARFTADAHEALHAAEADLAAGNIVVIYPEGSVTRAHDYHANKLNLRLRTLADYLVGEPVDLSAQRARLRAGQSLTGELLKETTDLIMSRVRDQLADLRGVPAPRAFHPRPSRELPGDASGSAA